MSDDFLNLLTYDDNGNLTPEIAANSDIECTIDGIAHNGPINPRIVGDPACQTPTTSAACNPIFRTCNNLLWKYPVMCRNVEDINLVTGNATGAGVQPGFFWTSPFAQIVQPANTSETLTGFTQSDICFNVGIQDLENINFEVALLIEGEEIFTSEILNYEWGTNPTSSFRKVGECVRFGQSALSAPGDPLSSLGVQIIVRNNHSTEDDDPNLFIFEHTIRIVNHTYYARAQ